jgi:SAM-dependent MidA family methyltransferase
MSLREKIVAEIQTRGPIPFSRYMEMCLYDPELGYYSRATEKFGKAGDFFTSSDVHAVFGRLLARQFEEMWRALDSPVRLEVVELGPGRGLFARDVLDWAEKAFPQFFAALHYRLVESSPALRARLQETLAAHLASGKASVAEVVALSPAATPVIVFANEFFDALPVEVIAAEGEVRVEVVDAHLVERCVPVTPPVLEFLDRYGVHPEADERVEAGLAAQAVMSQIAAAVERGFIIAIDYGYTRPEQLAGRHRGTLRAFRQHSMSADPYEAPGEQDLTADVNFTALAAAAEAHGLHAAKLLTQSQFLMGIGEANQFADAFADCRLPQERAKVALQLKHLVTPAGMGESFQVLVMSQGVPRQALEGLSGLRFGRM